MIPYRQSTKNLNTIYYITLTFLTISQTISELAPGVKPHTAVFLNQTCHQGKCYKFNLELLVQEQWEFLAREGTSSCYAFSETNMTYFSQVPLKDSRYTIAETTTTPPQDTHEDDSGLPQISEITFMVDGFNNSDDVSTNSPSKDSTAPLIPQPAVQKMAVAKKVTSELA